MILFVVKFELKKSIINALYLYHYDRNQKPA